MSDHTVGGRFDIEESPGAGRRRGRPSRLADVADSAAGDVALEGARRLQFDFFPSLFGDRRQVAVEIVHCGVPFKLPIANEPPAGTVSRAGATAGELGSGGGSSRKSTVGEKNSPPVTAVEKSKIRSVLPGGSPRNMLRNIRSVTCGVREEPMK